MKKKRFCKVALERVSRTDLICVACNSFRTEWAIVPIGGGEPVAGLHNKCIPLMHVRHGRKSKKDADAGARGDVDGGARGEDVDAGEAAVALREAMS